VYNYKFFLLFLFYTFLATVFDALALLPDFVHFFRSGSGGPEAHAATVALVFLTVVLDMAFAASLLGFIVMHSNLVSQNMTTIEMYEKKKSIPWRYDYGKQKNFTEVFGSDRLFMFLPMHTSAHMVELVRAAACSPSGSAHVATRTLLRGSGIGATRVGLFRCLNAGAEVTGGVAQRGVCVAYAPSSGAHLAKLAHTAQPPGRKPTRFAQGMGGGCRSIFQNRETNDASRSDPSRSNVRERVLLAAGPPWSSQSVQSSHQGAGVASSCSSLMLGLDRMPKPVPLRPMLLLTPWLLIHASCVP